MVRALHLLCRLVALGASGGVNTGKGIHSSTPSYVPVNLNPTVAYSCYDLFHFSLLAYLQVLSREYWN